MLLQFIMLLMCRLVLFIVSNSENHLKQNYEAKAI